MTIQTLASAFAGAVTDVDREPVMEIVAQEERAEFIVGWESANLWDAVRPPKTLTPRMMQLPASCLRCPIV